MPRRKGRAQRSFSKDGVMNRPSPIRAVIFGMDGVLTGSEPLINAAAVAMLKEQGLLVQPATIPPAAS
jgi:hypothetical protein